MRLTPSEIESLVGALVLVLNSAALWLRQRATAKSVQVAHQRISTVMARQATLQTTLRQQAREQETGQEQS